MGVGKLSGKKLKIILLQLLPCNQLCRKGLLGYAATHQRLCQVIIFRNDFADQHSTFLFAIFYWIASFFNIIKRINSKIGLMHKP